MRLISEVDGTYQTTIEQTVLSLKDLQENAEKDILLLQYHNSYKVLCQSQKFQKWLRGPCECNLLTEEECFLKPGVIYSDNK